MIYVNYEDQNSKDLLPSIPKVYIQCTLLALGSFF